MSKKKRVRRDIEKFSRGGRYWELLRLLEAEDLVIVHAREHQDAWKAVVRSALKDSRGFDEWLREVESLKTLPTTPDVRLLVCLSRIMDDQEPPEDPMQLKGLSPEAERLRPGLVALAAFPARLPKLRTQLAKFVSEPEKITRRYYEDLASLIPVGSVATRVRLLGEYIPSARALNNKAAVARGWGGLDIGRIRRVSEGVQRAGSFLPEDLREVLLHPFVHNLAVMCRRLAPDATKSRTAELVVPMFFFLRRLCGEKFEAVERTLLTGRGALLDRGKEGLNAFREKVVALEVEEKAALLGTFRNRVTDLPPEEMDFDPDDFFDEDDDEGEDREEEGSGREDLAAALLLLEHSLLKDIQNRQATLPLRDKKELARVMEPVLLRDISFISDTLESPEALTRLLDASISAGCAGVKMALLAIVVGEGFRDRELVKQGQKALDRLPVPVPEDFKWLCSEWGYMFFPKARALKHLLARFEKDEALLSVLVKHLCTEIELTMAEYTVKAEKSWVPAAFRSLYSVDPPEELFVVRRELQSLTDFQSLDQVRFLLDCYDDGRYTTEGNLCWLKALHSMNPDTIWEHIARELGRFREAERHSRGKLTLRSLEALRAGKIEAALLFVWEHFDDLARISVEPFRFLLTELLKNAEIPTVHHPLLIRLEKELVRRVDLGEQGLESLRDLLRQLLKQMAKAEPAKRKPRRKKP